MRRTSSGGRTARSWPAAFSRLEKALWKRASWGWVEVTSAGVARGRRCSSREVRRGERGRPRTRKEPGAATATAATLPIQAAQHRTEQVPRATLFSRRNRRDSGKSSAERCATWGQPKREPGTLERVGDRPRPRRRHPAALPPVVFFSQHACLSPPSASSFFRYPQELRSGRFPFIRFGSKSGTPARRGREIRSAFAFGG